MYPDRTFKSRLMNTIEKEKDAPVLNMITEKNICQNIVENGKP